MLPGALSQPEVPAKWGISICLPPTGMCSLVLSVLPLLAFCLCNCLSGPKGNILTKKNETKIKQRGGEVENRN
jgi:hypothetical protein